IQAGAVGFHLCRHQLALREKEKLFTVPAPDGVLAAVRRDLLLAARPGKGRDINLPAPRLVRVVGDEAPVGGEPGARLIELWVLYKQEGPALAGERRTFPFIQTPQLDESRHRFAPDGRFVAMNG